jgi:RND superfamily putative drug exporter
LLTIVAGLSGSGVAARLVDGGYYPSSAESARVEAVLAADFHAGTPNLVLVAQADSSVDDPAVQAAGRRLTADLAAASGVVYAVSYWTAGLPALRGSDGRSAIVAVLLAGDENTALQRARALLPAVTHRDGGLRVFATGLAEVDAEIQQQSEADLRRAELVAAPVTALILLAVFGSAVAAGLPLVIGTVTVLATLAVLRVLASVTSVSLFAMNLTTALALGLAVDYSLLIVARYREELDAGYDTGVAIARTMATAGRTVLFSATTVALAVSALLVFPLYFLRSLGYAAVAVVILSAAGALFLLPATLGILGNRVARFNLLAPFGVSGRLHAPSRFWRAVAERVVRRPLLTGIAAAAILAVLALPFAHAHFGINDERVLPESAMAHRTGDLIRAQFAAGELTPVEVVLPGASASADSATIDDFARRLSLLPHVQRVDAVTGSYGQGEQLGSAGQDRARFAGPAGCWLAVITDAAPASPAGERVVRLVRSTPVSLPRIVGGRAAVQIDAADAITGRLPLAATVILVSMFILLLLFSGGILIPLKAILLSLLSLTASFGAIVYVFQDGHLQDIVGNVTPTGQLEMTVPVLVFCLAFGLSMDYEVFLLSRIAESYRATADNTRSVVAGMAGTGRLFTAAAVVVASVMAALATSELALIKLVGVGLALAVLMDATVVRGLLVPAFMRLAGNANWWAPAPLRRLLSQDW